MTVPLLRFALVGLGMILTPCVFAAPDEPDPPKVEREAKQADDPLPPGAKVRFGVSRHILRTNPAVGLVPPGYTTMLAPTMTGGIRPYDVKTGRPLGKQGIVGPGRVVVSADGKRAAVARPGALTVVDAANGKLIVAVEPPEGILLVGTPGVSLSADGKILAFGARGKDNQGAAVVLDVDNNEVLATVVTGSAGLVFPELSRDGKTLVTLGPPPPAPTAPQTQPGARPAPPIEPADTARLAQVWETAGGKERFKARVTGMGGVVVAAAFSADGARLALSAGDGPVDVWDVKAGKRLQTMLGHKGQGLRLAFSPDGKTLAAIGRDYRIQRWGTDGKPLEETPAFPGLPVGAITRLTFVDNQRVIAWMTVHQFAFVWEPLAQTLLSPEMSHQAGIFSIALPAEEKNAITSGTDGKQFGWDRETGEQTFAYSLTPAHLPGQPLIRPVVTLSADGKRAVWSHIPTPEVFDLASGASQFVVPLPSTAPAPVHLNHSPDGTKFLAISRQADNKKGPGACVVWDLEARQRLGEFDVEPSGSGSPPIALLSPDGSRVGLLTTRTRLFKTALLFVGYDLKTGKKLAEVEEAVSVSGQVSIVAANNESMVIASTAGRVWPVNYARGEIGKDFDKLPLRGEAPGHVALVFSPDGKRFAVGMIGQPYTTYGVRVYDWPQGKPLKTFLGHRGPVTTLRFSSDGKYLASGSQDTSVLLWDLTKLADEK